MAARMESAPHTLLVSTALLRLLRAEVVRVRRAHDQAEFRLHRSTAREESAAAEIEALSQEVASLQDQASCSGDAVIALKQRVVVLERTATEREDLLSEKEEALLSARLSARSMPSTCAESSLSSTPREHVDASDSDGDESSCDSSSDRDSLLLELEAHTAALRIELADACARAEETVALLAEERSARAELEEQIDRLQDCARVMEGDITRAADAAATAEEARQVAEEDAREARARVSEALEKRTARVALEEHVERLDERARAMAGDLACALDAASKATEAQRQAEEDANGWLEQIGRLEDRSRAAEGDLARAMETVADSRRVQCLAEQDADQFRARVLESADEHERTVQRLGIDQREREEAARIAAQQSRQIMEALITELRLDLTEASAEADAASALHEDERSARALLEERVEKLEEARRAAEDDVREVGARMREVVQEHDQRLTQLAAEQHERENASLRAALQSQLMLQSLQQAFSDRAELQNQEISALRQRLGEGELTVTWSSSLDNSVATLQPPTPCPASELASPFGPALNDSVATLPPAVAVSPSAMGVSLSSCGALTDSVATLPPSAAEIASVEESSTKFLSEVIVQAGTSASTDLHLVGRHRGDLPW